MAISGSWLRDSPGDVLALFREHSGGLTKAEAMRLTGLSRTAVSARVDALAQVGLLTTKASQMPEGRGRPAERFELNREFGITLVADTGATGMRVAVFDAVGHILDERYEAFDISDGPETILGRIEHQFDSLLEHRRQQRVLGIGIDLPGPVDFSTRRIISPPTMTGWHNYDIVGHFRAKYPCPIIVEKDTNAMAFGEQRRQYPATEDLMFVKLGTGIGAGLVIRSELFRGADGAAGDIGHTPYPGAEKPLLCRCGERGCLEAYASGWALARDLTAAGYPCASVNDVIALVRSGNTTALALVRRASEMIGTAIGDLVNMVNPRLSQQCLCHLIQ